MNFDAIVIGGGLAGSATAYHLVREGGRALLVDRGDQGQSTFAGAGILSPETTGAFDTEMLPFAFKSATHYTSLVESLHGDGIVETGYKRTSLLLTATEADMPQFEATRAKLLERLEPLGFADRLTDIAPEDARKMFPPLGPIAAALYQKEAARVDSHRLSQALQKAGERNGLKVLRRAVERIIIEGGQARGVVINGEPYYADHVVVAAGAWSEQFAKQIQLRIPIQPMRGQVVHLRYPSEEGETSRWPMLTPVRGNYIIPWERGRLVVGGTREPDAGFDARITAAGMHQVFQQLFETAPGLANAEVIEMRVGLRPMTPDGRPLIGPVPHIEGLWFITGLGATGQQTAPFAGRIIADWIRGMPSPVDTSLFDVARFSQGA